DLAVTAAVDRFGCHSGSLLSSDGGDPARAQLSRRYARAGRLWGTGEAAQVRLYLGGLVLADVPPGDAGADAGHPARLDVGGEQLGRLVRVAVQPGYACGCSAGAADEA